MKNIKQLNSIIIEIHRTIYAEIGVDLDEVDKSVEMWFLDYFLPQKRQDELMEEVISKYKLSKLYKDVIRRNVWLGATPKGT